MAQGKKDIAKKPSQPSKGALKSAGAPTQSPFRGLGQQPQKPIGNETNWKNYLRGKYTFPVIIVLLCLLLYGNTFNNDYAEDDAIYTKENVLIKHGFSDFKYLFTKGTMYGSNLGNGVPSYRPLVLLSFMTETSFFGLNPHVYHRFHVLYFAITCLIFFFFLQKVFQKVSSQWSVVSGQFLAIAGTLLFIFHPIHTDVVANVKSRDELLALLFGLLSFYLLLKSVGDKNFIVPVFLFSVIAFALSLLCKETSVSYFIIIPLLLYFFTPLNLKRIAMLTIPFAGIIVLYLIIRRIIFGAVSYNDPISVMNNSLIAAKNGWDMYATNFVMMGKYLYLLFIPYPLSWDYSYPQFPIVSWGNIWAIVSLLMYIGMGILIIMGIKKKSIYSFAILFYLITLFLSSNLMVKIACSFGERFLFSPSVGFCMAIPVLLADMVKNQKNSVSLITYRLSLITILLIYACILIPRNRDWKNDYTLFLSGIEGSPNSGRTHGALASVYMDSAQSAKNPAGRAQYFSLAAHQFKEVTRLFTMDPDGYYNLGVCYYGEGNMDSAVIAYKNTLELNPKYTSASNNIGVIYFNKARFDLALPYFNMSYKIDSNDINTLLNMGACYQNEKNYALAFHYDNLVLKKAPGNRLGLNNLSVMCNDIGIQYVSANELDKAMQEFYSALKYDSNSVNAIGNIGVVYSKKGNIEMAKKYFEKALQKDLKNVQFAGDLQALNGK